jgi:hypothetical protein
MPAARIVCPGCKTVMTSAQAFEPGKVVDCPTCQLLFVPTSADQVLPVPNPSPFPPRRRRSKKRTDLKPALIAGVVLVILSIVASGGYLLFRLGHRPVTPVAPPLRSDHVGDSISPPRGAPEIEDDRPPPRKPVPSLDDDPPAKPLPP